MQPASRKFEWVVWSALVFTMVVIAAAFVLSEIRKRQSPEAALPLSYSLPDFTLTNQFGQTVSLSDLRGQVWIADIIFTRCGGPCPLMTKRMSELQRAWPKEAPVKLVTLTTDPEYDKPSVLKQYSERFGAEPGRWHFLTGTKQQIGHVAIDGMKLIATEKKQSERENDRDLFVHSTLFVIVDQQGRVRSSFEYDDPAMVKKVTTAVKKLMREK
jgi:protein SCO1